MNVRSDKEGRTNSGKHHEIDVRSTVCYVSLPSTYGFIGYLEFSICSKDRQFLEGCKNEKGERKEGKISV